MPRFYDQVGVNNVDLYRVPQRFNKATVNAEIAEVDEQLALSDGALQNFLNLEGNSKFPTVQDLRDALQAEKDTLNYILMFWDMDTIQTTFEEIISTYFFANAVQSFCGEEPGDEAVNVLAVVGKWAHILNHQHEIVLDFGFPVQVDAIKIPIDMGVNATHQLQGVDVFGAKSIGGLANATNQVLIGINFDIVGGDNEHTFTKHIGRYWKFTIASTANSVNTIRVKQILFRVIPKFFNDLD